MHMENPEALAARLDTLSALLTRLQLVYPRFQS